MIWTTINGFLTGILLILFVGIILWAWHPQRKKTFDDMANLPLNDQAEENHHES